MSTTLDHADTSDASDTPDAPGADEGQSAPVDPVQEGAPATGPEAPTPPSRAVPDDDGE